MLVTRSRKRRISGEPFELSRLPLRHHQLAIATSAASRAFDDWPILIVVGGCIAAGFAAAALAGRMPAYGAPFSMD